MATSIGKPPVYREKKPEKKEEGKKGMQVASKIMVASLVLVSIVMGMLYIHTLQSSIVRSVSLSLFVS